MATIPLTTTTITTVTSVTEAVMDSLTVSTEYVSVIMLTRSLREDVSQRQRCILWRGVGDQTHSILMLIVMEQMPLVMKLISI